MFLTKITNEIEAKKKNKHNHTQFNLDWCELTTIVATHFCNEKIFDKNITFKYLFIYLFHTNRKQNTKPYHVLDYCTISTSLIQLNEF